MEASDQYRTIKKAVEGPVFKEKGSKFIGFAFPVKTEDQIKEYLDDLKRSFHSASHFCYAYQLGFPKSTFRANDDGEPANSAGKPILGQLNSEDLTEVLLVVIRYYGGTKLGVGGLIQAYKTAARYCLDEAEIIVKTLSREFELKFEYNLLSTVMRFIKANQMEIIDQQMSERCRVVVSIRASESEIIKSRLRDIYGLQFIQL